MPERTQTENPLDVHIAAYRGENLYDFDNEILLNWYPQRVIARCASSTSILELGLGHGFSTRIFSEHFERHVVLEGSPAVIRNFREKCPSCRAEIVQTYFEAFETEERFDVIVMGFILEHVDDPFQIIDRFKRFLTPEGKMFLAVPNAEVLNRRFGYLAGLLKDMTDLSENDRLLGHKRYYTVKTLVEEICRADCEIDRLEGIYLKPFTTSQILSLSPSAEVIRAMCEVAVDYPELSCAILAQVSHRGPERPQAMQKIRSSRRAR